MHQPELSAAEDAHYLEVLRCEVKRCVPVVLWGVLVLHLCRARSVSGLLISKSRSTAASTHNVEDVVTVCGHA